MIVIINTAEGGRRTINFPEHPPHLLDEIEIEEERLWIPLILLKRNSKSIMNTLVSDRFTIES